MRKREIDRQREGEIERDECRKRKRVRAIERYIEKKRALHREKEREE